MPFMQRIDEYGIAFHGGVNPGYPASHGCMRLPMKFAEKLYGVTKVGTKVDHRRLTFAWKDWRSAVRAGPSAHG